MNTKKILTFLLPVQFIGISILSFFPEFVEKYYSLGIYTFISRNFRFLFGWIPFSIGDLFYFSAIFMILRFVFYFFKSKIKKSEVIWLIGAALSITYFLFYALWGLNYSRLNLYQKFNLQEQKPSKEQLIRVSEKILTELTSVQNQLVSNDSLAVETVYSKEEIFELVPLGYQNLSIRFPNLSYQPTSLKKSLISLPLTYMGFSGYLNPFTGEAQVDYLMPKVSIPFVCSHEIAHQIGIGFESEANFIGFLAARSHGDPFIQYSGLLVAYRYFLYDLARTDFELFEEFKIKTPKGIIKNIQEIEDFWASYDNFTEVYFETFYDNYLKLNHQEDGLKSYSQMTALIMAYDDTYGF